MKKNSKLWLLLLTFAFVVSMLVACGGDTEEADSSGNTNDNASEEENNEEETNEGNTENNSEEADNPEEITLKWAHQWGEENFEDTIGRFVRDEFPHITFEIQEAGTDHPETLENLIAAKDSPDIVTMGLMTHAPFMEDLGLAYDMDELIEQEGFDLSRFEPSIIEFARNQDPTDNGGLYSLPIARPTFSLHYNRDVFDMVGVSYPTDDMTWSEVIDLAREVTREMNGVQYRGLDLDVPYDAYTQFSQNSVDPETDEVLIQESEAYRRYLEMIDETVSIPGNYPADDPASVLMNWGSLFGEGNIAMYPAKTHHGFLGTPNMDIVTYPVWEGYENTAPEPNGSSYAITEPSEHKEAALEVLEYLFSDEVQMIKSKEGQASVVTTPEVHEVFAEEVPEFQGKNLESLFKHGYATGPEQSANYGDGVLWTAPVEFVNSGQDINEFLRVLQEQAEENVRAAKESE